MDRIEKHRQGHRRSQYANEPEISERDRPLLVTPTGRQPSEDNGAPAVAREEVMEKTPQAQKRSDVTDFQDPGTDSGETDDSLNETEEAIRHAAEDTPTGADPNAVTDDIPVFDRASLPPKV